MSFEQFVPINKGVNSKNTYTIQAGKKKSGYFNGTIYFNGGMRDALNLHQYAYVELFTDRDNKLIAIRPTNEKTEHIRVMRKNGNNRFITCSSWLYVAVSELGYVEKSSGSYKVIDGGLIVLEKPEPLSQG
jgi:hypothetical protein